MTAPRSKYRSQRAAACGLVETIFADLPTATAEERAYLDRARALILDAALALLDAEDAAEAAQPQPTEARPAA
jgi:hypothetical protein